MNSDEEEGSEPAPNNHVIHSPYKPPKQRNLRDILEQDAHDESLFKYKQKLLPSLQSVIVDERDERCVIPESIQLLLLNSDQSIKEEITFSLHKSHIESLKSRTVNLAVGCPYKFRLSFRVQRDIVTGLQFHVHFKKSNVLMQHFMTDKSIYMIGSHAPTHDIKTYDSPVELAPKNRMARGKYVVKNVLCDDYGTEFVKWEWSLKIVAKDDDDEAVES